MRYAKVPPMVFAFHVLGAIDVEQNRQVALLYPAHCELDMSQTTAWPPRRVPLPVVVALLDMLSCCQRQRLCTSATSVPSHLAAAGGDSLKQLSTSSRRLCVALITSSADARSYGRSYRSYRCHLCIPYLCHVRLEKCYEARRGGCWCLWQH
jgi:hypothetical protein